MGIKNFFKSFFMVGNKENATPQREKPKPSPIVEKELIKQEKTIVNPKFHRTEREEDMSFNFSEKHCNKLSKLEGALYAAKANIGKCGKRWQKSASVTEITEAIQKCNTAILAYETLKIYCYKTKGGQIYFQDMWEYCHNSHNPCFSYIDDVLKLKEELTKLDKYQ